MKVIGIDIAIENLAFCKMTIDEQFCEIELKKEDWFVLDTTPEDYKQECCHENKNNKKCTKDAGWFYIDKSTNIYHFYCIAHKKVFDKNKEKSWKTLNKNYIKNNEVIRSIFEKLDKYISYFREAEYIVIEKQPPKNPKMIAIMNYIYSYFVIRLWNDVLEGEQPKLKDIVFLDAKNKVAYCESVLPKEIKEELQKKYDPKKNKYQYNKKVSNATIQYEIKDKELLDYFNSHKKTDDLADTRNMLLWWLQKNTPKPQKIKKEKLKKSNN